MYFIKKNLDDYIYKQLELGGVIVIKLAIDFGELVKVELKKTVRQEKWWVSGLRGIWASGFCGPCVCLGVFLLF
jgi:hypothetical protein